MKWVNFFFISCLFVIIMTSCYNNKNNDPSLNSQENESTNENLIENSTSKMQMTHKDDKKLNKVLSIEQAEYLISVWDKSDWDPDVTKTLCHYRFEFDGLVIRYSPEAGVFIDDTNQKHLIVTKEQRDYINSFVIGVQ